MVAKKPSAAPMRTFELRRVSFVQLKAIDVVDQTFSAHVMLECCLRGGALDDDLMKTSDGWPAAPTADGSFRPSALWYLNNQFDWPTAQQFSVLESKVFRVGNDLHLVQRVDGVFSRPMNLRYFPFDTQELTATLCVTCAAEGPVPARLAVAPDVRASATHSALPTSGYRVFIPQVLALSPPNPVSVACTGARLDRPLLRAEHLAARPVALAQGGLITNKE